LIKRGEGDKARVVPLNATVRDALQAIRPSVAERLGSRLCHSASTAPGF
jgi:hypothetical protein